MSFYMSWIKTLAVVIKMKPNVNQVGLISTVVLNIKLEAIYGATGPKWLLFVDLLDSSDKVMHAISN